MTQSGSTIPIISAQLQGLLNSLSNRTIGSLAEELSVKIAPDAVKTKGLIGQLVERYLGVENNNLPSVDFADLQLELKTIPVNSKLQPLESTYVCTVESNRRALRWQDSWACKKLSNVLWVPILVKENSNITEHTALQPILWQPSAEVNAILEQDFIELMDLFYLGEAGRLNAKYGTYLHIRPKAANSRTVVDYLDSNNLHTKIVPKGFYLRTQLTKQILKQDGRLDKIVNLA